MFTPENLQQKDGFSESQRILREYGGITGVLKALATDAGVGLPFV